jgi:hypothetical protein
MLEKDPLGIVEKDTVQIPDLKAARISVSFFKNVANSPASRR